MTPLNIDCVVVTYNRLSLLKECLNAISSQTYPINKIIIINNNSTDGTIDFLSTLSDNPLYKIINLEKNIGGAGGFSRGIEEGVKDGADWCWIMDDDTIPTTTALECLVNATKLTDNIGFVCSKVLWTDGTPHLMNLQKLYPNTKPFNFYSTSTIPAFEVKTASFVSIMINSNCIKKIGLPIAEFFIWADDMEYTYRIHRNGYKNFYIDNSIVIHKTGDNYMPHPDTAPENTAWKFYYQARNVSFLKKQEKGFFPFILSTLNMYRVYIHRINKRKDNNKKLFKKYIRKGCIDGLKFNPSIKYIK